MKQKFLIPALTAFIVILILVTFLLLLMSGAARGYNSIVTPTSPPPEGEPFLVEWNYANLLIRVITASGTNYHGSFIDLTYEDSYGSYNLVIPAFRVDGNTIDYFYYWIPPCNPSWIFPPRPPYCTIPENVYTITEATLVTEFGGGWLTHTTKDIVGATYTPVVVWLPSAYK